MPEDVARAVGAGDSSDILVIADKECTPRPLGLRELLEVERDCLNRFRRSYLESWQNNLELLPAEDRFRVMQEKIEESSRWDIGDLPPKYVYDSDRVKLTNALREWLNRFWAIKEQIDDDRMQRLTAAALDQGSLSEKEYRRMTDEEAWKFSVPYVNWWITGSHDGKVTMLWKCFSQHGITREQIIDHIGSDLRRLSELSRSIERLSAPQVGNG